MKLYSIFLMGIIFSSLEIQAMNKPTTKNREAFTKRLKKEEAEWRQRNPSQINDTFECIEIKKALEQYKKNN